MERNVAVEIRLKAARNKKFNFLLSKMIELFATNQMSHFPPSYDEFFLYKFNFKDWIFYSAVICGPELCKQNRIMKTRLATNIDGYSLRLPSLFE